MKKLHLLAAVCALLTFFTTSSQAAIITWTLNDVVLSDNQTLTGGFDYDSDNNTFSNISITTSGDASFESMTFNQTAYIGACDQLGCRFNDSAPAVGDILLSLNWQTQLTNAGGTKGFSLDNVFFECTTADCVSNIAQGNQVSIVSGTLSSAPDPVPVPAAVWLFGSGLLGLIGVARRKKA